MFRWGQGSAGGGLFRKLRDGSGGPARWLKGAVDPVVPPDEVLQDLEEPEPVLAVQEDALAGVAPAGDVLSRALAFDTQRLPCDEYVTLNTN